MSDYFDASGNRISDGLTARATDVNTLRDEVGAGFDLLPDAAKLNYGTVDYAVDSGAANAYVVAMHQTAASYVDGMLLAFKALATNTAASTVNVDSLGVKSLKRQNGEDLVAGDILINKIVTFRYNSTAGWFEMIQAGNTELIPQNSKSANYTTVLADSGRHILHPASDNNPRTFTIDSNANVAYDIGTAITFVNMANTLTIAITSDTMYLMDGSGSTGSRTLVAYGSATALKIAATTWVISGTGLA